MIAPAHISAGVRLLLVAFGPWIALRLFVQLQGIIVLVLAMTLATGISPVVDWLASRKMPPNGWQAPRWIPILGTLLAIVIAALGLFYFLGSVLWQERGQAWEDLPGLRGWTGRVAG